MKENNIVLNTFFAVVCAVFLYKTSFAEPANLGLLQKEVIAYHNSGDYQKELAQVISNADRFLIKSADINSHRLHPKKLAIVLDIDETCLSNYNRIVAREFSGDREKIRKDTLAADAQPIKPMVSLYNNALKHGIAVFFVTGRKPSEQQATIKNLKSAGYQAWTHIYFKPANYSLKSAIPFKSQTRAAITKQGYTIITSIGDQESDLKGGYAEQTFKLPNPYYYVP